MNMTYKIIQPPFTLKFREMSKKELKDYFQWFLGMIPNRINELTIAVRQVPESAVWQPNKTPASLDVLGNWLFTQVKTRQQTEEELQKIKDGLVFPMEISGEELTNRTFSLAIDAGMYLSQVFLQNYPSLRWNQEFGNKKFIDYGQPVLIEFGPAPFNPVRMMVTLAYGLSDKTWNGRQLREIYDYWAKQVRE